jgi:hypothetical protein
MNQPDGPLASPDPPSLLQRLRAEGDTVGVVNAVRTPIEITSKPLPSPVRAMSVEVHVVEVVDGVTGM